ESSPNAGRPDFDNAASAFRRAFSEYVSPTSSTSVSKATSSTPALASSSRYSPILPALPVAMTSRGRSGKRGEGALLSDDQVFDPFGGQTEHRIEVAARRSEEHTSELQSRE